MSCPSRRAWPLTCGALTRRTRTAGFVGHCHALDPPLANVKRLVDLVQNPTAQFADADADIYRRVDTQLTRASARLESMRACEKRWVQRRLQRSAEHSKGVCDDPVSASMNPGCRVGTAVFAAGFWLDGAHGGSRLRGRHAGLRWFSNDDRCGVWLHHLSAAVSTAGGETNLLTFPPCGTRVPTPAPRPLCTHWTVVMVRGRRP